MTGALSCPPLYEPCFRSQLGQWSQIQWHKTGGSAVTAAHTAFIHGNGSNRLFVSSFCPSSVVPHLTPKEEVTAVALNTSAMHSAESLPLLPLPTSSYSYPDFNNLPGITAGNHFALMLS